MSKGFLALYWISKFHGLLYLCLAIVAALSTVVCKERALGTRSLLIPASLACAKAWAVRLPNAGAQCIPASSKSSRACVWPDVCASVTQRKCKASKMAGAGLLQSPLPVVEDGSMGLRLCNSETPFSIPCSWVPSPRDASPQQQVAGMQLCCSDIKFNFLLFANMSSGQIQDLEDFEDMHWAPALDKRTAHAFAHARLVLGWS